MKNNTFGFGAKLALFLCLLIPSTAGATGYTLTVNAQGSGTVTKNPTNATYPAGVVVTLTATPSNGWYFANWSGDTNGSLNPLNVTMNSSLVITGNFLAFPTYSLTLVTNGQGAIDLNPPGGSYPSNTLVTVTATPATGWVFTGWSGGTNGNINPLTLALDSNISLTGNFAQLPAFDVQPVSVTNIAGSTVNFSANAVGTAPLNYQWFFSGGSLNGVTTNTTLALTNISSGQTGNYWVVATNNYGSATSQIASLTLKTVGGPTNVVNSPDEASLRAAIALGGWVGLGFNGTITISNTIAISNNVVLDGSSVAAIISGGNAVRLFYVAPGASLTATNLTLANGSCNISNGTPADAGAIYNDGGTVTLVACTLTNNSAIASSYGGLARGGAIFNNSGTVSLFTSSFSSNGVVGGFTGPGMGENAGSGFGGAIFTTNGSVNIMNCVLNGNLCNSGAGYSYVPGGGTIGGSIGGAVFQASGSLTVVNSIFSLNQALGGNGPNSSLNDIPGNSAYGGAIAANGGSVAIDHSQFIANTANGGNAGFDSSGASGFGGAVYSAAVLTVNDSSFSGNQTFAGNKTVVPMGANKGTDAYGGAIYNLGTAWLNRCSVYSNYVQGGSAFPYGPIGGIANGGNGFGGGIFNVSQLTATNCTIALNSATGGGGSGNGSYNITGNAFGGGVFNNTNATFVAMNLTIASNSCSSPAGQFFTNGFAAGDEVANTSGTLRLHNSLIAYGTNGNAYGPVTDDGFNICSDGTANLNSGSSFNFTDPQLAPLANYGGPTLCMALLPASPAIDNGDPANFPATDQRGFARLFGAGPDMGAYEYGSSLTGATTNIVASPDEASLRAAIQIGGWVGFGFSGTITITNTIAISNNVILDGSGVAAIISGGNAVRLFYVAPGASLSATNLTLANGSYIVTNGTADAGAIYNDGGTVTLFGCTLTNNSAQSLVNGYWPTLARGGAIFNNGGVVLLNQSGISNNAAIGERIGTDLGGALYNNNGTVTIKGCNVGSNVCLGLSGDGMGLAMGGAAFQASGSLTVSNSVFALNQAIGGSFIGFPGGTPSSPAYGGALAAAGGSVTIDHSQFCANIARGGDASTSGNAGPAAGGAVYSTSALTVRDSSFFGNQSLAGNNTPVNSTTSAGIAAFGGAIYNSGMAVLNRCSVYSNYVQGGTAFYVYSPPNGGDAFGGGIFNASQLAATNCTIAFNSASGGNGGVINYRYHGQGGNAVGGGVFNNTNATFIAMNLTIAGNGCWSPPGFLNYPSDNIAAGAEIANTNGMLRLHNSIIAYGGYNSNAYGSITDDGYNICSDGSANFSSGSSFNSTNPQLAPLANYGGPTLCMALLPTSPAIDNGDPADFPATDQRGYVRPSGSGPDMGAYEFGAAQAGALQLNIAPTTGSVVLSFLTSAPGLYHLQASTNLTVWTDLTTYGPFTGATNISQTISRQAFNALYFRLRVQ
jgi:hypothetical protein